jgi:hypothetical protein
VYGLKFRTRKLRRMVNGKEFGVQGLRLRVQGS